MASAPKWLRSPEIEGATLKERPLLMGNLGGSLGRSGLEAGPERMAFSGSVWAGPSGVGR